MPPVIPTIAALAARLYYRINIALITTEFTSPQRKDRTCTYSIAIKTVFTSEETKSNVFNKRALKCF